jgi:hypothetical protein
MMWHGQDWLGNPGSTLYSLLIFADNLAGWDTHAFSGNGRTALVLRIHCENEMASTKHGITTFIGFSKLCHKV